MRLSQFEFAATASRYNHAYLNCALRRFSQPLNLINLSEHGAIGDWLVTLVLSILGCHRMNWAIKPPKEAVYWFAHFFLELFI